MKTIKTGLVCVGLLTAGAADAHFQLIYTEDTQIAQPGEVDARLIFWHPLENGHVMDMGAPEEFYVINRGKAVDLMQTLAPITFTGKENSAAAYATAIPVRRSGDYVTVIKPAPYYEASEDVYIQQITKTYMNFNEIPTDWMEAQGLDTEILPLVKPYNIPTGGLFTGQVLRAGAPAAGIEIEVEFMAAEPNMATNSPKAPTTGPLPGGAMVVISDMNGYFSFGLPKAGYWGFAALGSGPETEFNGKELSQDAVIWVRAYDMPVAQ